jgi:hypothetical protein
MLFKIENNYEVHNNYKSDDDDDDNTSYLVSAFYLPGPYMGYLSSILWLITLTLPLSFKEPEAQNT